MNIIADPWFQNQWAKGAEETSFRSLFYLWGFFEGYKLQTLNAFS